jgi:hypothetical protein
MIEKCGVKLNRKEVHRRLMESNKRRDSTEEVRKVMLLIRQAGRTAISEAGEPTAERPEQTTDNGQKLKPAREGQ